jgi:hypothetical protein
MAWSGSISFGEGTPLPGLRKANGFDATAEAV